MNAEIKGRREFEFAGALFSVPEILPLAVSDERYESLPLYKRDGGWNDGKPLKGLEAYECSLADALQPDSVAVKLTDGRELKRGSDYEFTDKWGTFGRLEGGKIGVDTPVLISYSYIPMRLDSVVRESNGKLVYLTGTPASYCPEPPALPQGAERLLNCYSDSSTRELQADNLFPILQKAVTVEKATAMQRFLPRTMEMLRNGKQIRILAWGDSVTEAAYLPQNAEWQFQFVERLRARYPQAKIELISNGWGGRTVTQFLAEPPGSQYNFAETVLAVKPDLILSEFVNDAGLTPEAWTTSFPYVAKEFAVRGFEWVILTPHYVRPDWMGLATQNGDSICEDPRPYVKFLRKFSADNGIALADAAKLYGQLWKTGIPYNTLMTNNINHPNRVGMKLFADALMAIFD